MKRLAWGVILLTGCQLTPETYEADVGNLDVAFYECQIQPIFDRGCAFNACHGNPGRPFALYSVSKTRSLDGDALLGEPLTDYELCANFYRAGGFAQERPSQLLTKPMTVDGDRSQYHVGNYLFAGDSAEASCISAWLDGASQPMAAARFPPGACRVPWRTNSDGSVESCTPRTLDCAKVIQHPDTAPGGTP